MFFVVLISLFFVVYVNHFHCHLLFYLLVCAIFFLLLLYVHLFTPLLFCIYPYLYHQTLLLPPSPSLCLCCYYRRLIYSSAPPLINIEKYEIIEINKGWGVYPWPSTLLHISKVKEQRLCFVDVGKIGFSGSCIVGYLCMPILIYFGP